MRERQATLDVRGHPVSTLAWVPESAAALLVLAHGAGAGMEHPFMVGLARALAARRVATFRYHFPYAEARRRRPDPPAVLEATVAAAVQHAASELRGAPLFAGGKSMGGRMSSQAVARGLVDVRGLVFFGFPLHRPKDPATSRAAHLAAVRVPMLFVQGDRDDLAQLHLLEPIVNELGATLHVARGADHGFEVLKRSGRIASEVLEEIADVAARWMLQFSSAPASG